LLAAGSSSQRHLDSFEVLLPQLNVARLGPMSPWTVNSDIVTVEPVGDAVERLEAQLLAHSVDHEQSSALSPLRWRGPQYGLDLCALWQELQLGLERLA